MKTKKENQTVSIKTALDFSWGIRIKLRAEGDKLSAEGDKLRAEGDKLRAEGYKLFAEGDKLWAESILSFCGNITVEWTFDGCKLGNGMEFK